MMLQILTSLKTLNVPENLKLQKTLYHKLRFECVREKSIKMVTLANNFLSVISYRKIKMHCAEPFTEYWTCIDYTNLQELRRCRKQQAVFDNCVLEKLGWVRPDLGELSKVTSYLFGRIARFFSPFLWMFCLDQGSNSSLSQKVVHELNAGSLWT